MSDSQAILSQYLGTLDYRQAYEKQLAIHEQVTQGKMLGCVLLLEHPPTITFGKHGRPENLLFSPEVLEKEGVVCLRTDRGGEVTAHMPGQLVIYPILHLSRLGIGARAYVNSLLDITIATLNDWGIAGRTDEEHPGVWVGADKICAVGVRIKSRVSLHGIALNVNNDLSLFGKMIPCGIRQRGVTSLHQLTGETIDLSMMARTWLKKFSSHFGYMVDFQV